MLRERWGRTLTVGQVHGVTRAWLVDRGSRYSQFRILTFSRSRILASSVESEIFHDPLSAVRRCSPDFR